MTKSRKRRMRRKQRKQQALLEQELDELEELENQEHNRRLMDMGLLPEGDRLDENNLDATVAKLNDGPNAEDPDAARGSDEKCADDAHNAADCSDNAIYKGKFLQNFSLYVQFLSYNHRFRDIVTNRIVKFF